MNNRPSHLRQFRIAQAAEDLDKVPLCKVDLPNTHSLIHLFESIGRTHLTFYQCTKCQDYFVEKTVTEE